MAKRKIVASLATVPERERTLDKTLRSLACQVDEINVYLNGHKRVPAIVKQLGCNFAHSSEHGNLGDAGKFFWADKIADGCWCLTCDDDFFYEPRYAALLVKSAQRYGGDVPVSLHGVILNQRLRDGRAVNWLKEGRRVLLQARQGVTRDCRVHIVGTGVLCYQSGTLDISVKDFPVPNMADVWFARLCKEQQVKRFVVSHPPEMAKSICPPILEGPQQLRRSGEYARRIAEAAPWEKL